MVRATVGVKLGSDVLNLLLGELNANEAQGPVSESQHHTCPAWAPRPWSHQGLTSLLLSLYVPRVVIPSPSFQSESGGDNTEMGEECLILEDAVI